MTPFEYALKKLFAIEGGFSDHSADRGGATKYGVTLAVARANGYTGAMEDLSELTARHIAKGQYWDILRGDEISGLSVSIMDELFDTGYNCGVGTAGQFLQRALNALNRQGKDYPDVKVDGVVGPMTVHALRLYLFKRGSGGEVVLLRALNALQGAHYVATSEGRHENEAFTYGWFASRVAMPSSPDL